MVVKKSKWDDSKVEELKELFYEQRYSTKEIGQKLGFSKNAIVGKIHRLGLKKPSDEEVCATVEQADVAKIVYGKCKLAKLEDSMCVWPLGSDENIHFCGKPVLANTGKFYCEEHFEKAYLRFNQKGSKVSKGNSV